jgi:hypothetical protein
MIGKKKVLNPLKKTVEEYTFSRITIERHIKELTKLRIIEKIEDNARAGKQGRPTGRYRIRNEYRNSVELIGYIVPNMWQIDGEWFNGVWVRNPKTKGKHLRKKEWIGLPLEDSTLDLYSKRATSAL